NIQQRLRGRKLKYLPVLEKTIKSFLAQIEEPFFQGCVGSFRVNRFGLLSTSLLVLRGCGSRLYGKQDVEARAFRHRQNLVGNFVDRILLDFLATSAAVGPAYARVEQAQVVVDLSRRGYRRSRIARGVFLADGDGRCDPVDQVHVRLFNALQE